MAGLCLQFSCMRAQCFKGRRVLRAQTEVQNERRHHQQYRTVTAVEDDQFFERKVLSFRLVQHNPPILFPPTLNNTMYLASVSLRSIRSKTTRSLIVCSSVPKSFFAAATTAKSNEQKRPFWATTPAQKQNEEVKEGDEKVDKNILTTKQLVKLVAETHKLSKAESRRIMDTVFDSIAIVRTVYSTSLVSRSLFLRFVCF